MLLPGIPGQPVFTSNVSEVVKPLPVKYLSFTKKINSMKVEQICLDKYQK